MDVKKLREETKKLSLLYAEDEDDVRRVTEQFFLKYFGRVDSVANGKDGLELFKKHLYDVVISDIKMPIMGGDDMMIEISKIEPKTVTVSMSGLSRSDEDKKKVSDFSVLKPATIEELTKMMFLIEQEVKNRKK